MLWKFLHEEGLSDMARWVVVRRQQLWRTREEQGMAMDAVGGKDRDRKRETQERKPRVLLTFLGFSFCGLVAVM